MQALGELYQDFCICSLILGQDAENHGKHSIYGILDNFSSYLHSTWEKYLPTTLRILHVQRFHYICYTCYSYFVEFIIHLVINAKRQKEEKPRALKPLPQSTELLNNSFIHTQKLIT